MIFSWSPCRGTKSEMALSTPLACCFSSGLTLLRGRPSGHSFNLMSCSRSLFATLMAAFSSIVGAVVHGDLLSDVQRRVIGCQE